MKLVQHDAGRFYLELDDIRERERPPMLSVPECRRLCGQSDEAA